MEYVVVCAMCQHPFRATRRHARNCRAPACLLAYHESARLSAAGRRNRQVETLCQLVLERPATTDLDRLLRLTALGVLEMIRRPLMQSRSDYVIRPAAAHTPTTAHP